jgi:ATP-dependent DNA ligase
MATTERPQRKGVQLAYPAEEGRVKRLGNWFYIQPKLDGERCKTTFFHGEPVLLSSYENEFKFLDHLKEQISIIYKEFGPIQLDGEIYLHGWPRERIDSALRRSVNRNPEVEQLEYHVFDIAENDLKQGERLHFLSQLKNRFKFIKVVDTFKADTNTWPLITDGFMSLGYEGAILRRFDSFYTEKRTPNMLKYKPTAFDIYTIIEVEEAIDKYGEKKGMVGSFWVKGDDDISFSVGAGKLTHDKRIAYWEQRATLLGKPLKVKHGVILTTGGIPTCAVAVEVL